jgi:hypothetical protein
VVKVSHCINPLLPVAFFTRASSRYSARVIARLFLRRRSFVILVEVICLSRTTGRGPGGRPPSRLIPPPQLNAVQLTVDVQGAIMDM